MARTINRFGCTAIERDAEDTTIIHMGTKGHTEAANVRAGVDAMLGKGAFVRLRTYARWERDRDGAPQKHPDMIYAFRLSNDIFDRVVKRDTAAPKLKAA